VTVAVTVAPDAPVVGVAVSHAALEVTDQGGPLVVGTTVVVPAPEVGAHVALDKVRVVAAPGWVTVTVRVAVEAVNVTTPWRVVVAGFASAVRVAVAPDAPVVGVAVSHVALEVTDQDGALVAGTTPVVPPAGGASHSVLDRFRVAAAPACVTTTVRVMPPAVNVKAP
jgi:hypothetical protein